MPVAPAFISSNGDVGVLTPNANKLSPDAKEINREYELSQVSGLDAVKHAYECGKLLVKKFAELSGVTQKAWVEANCTFSYSSARNYVKLARKPAANALTLESLRHLHPSGRGNKKKSTSQPTLHIDPQAMLESSPSPDEKVRALLRRLAETCGVGITRQDIDDVRTWLEQLEKQLGG